MGQGGGFMMEIYFKLLWEVICSGRELDIKIKLAVKYYLLYHYT